MYIDPLDCECLDAVGFSAGIKRRSSSSSATLSTSNAPQGASKVAEQVVVILCVFVARGVPGVGMGGRQQDIGGRLGSEDRETHTIYCSEHTFQTAPADGQVVKWPLECTKTRENSAGARVEIMQVPVQLEILRIEGERHFRSTENIKMAYKRPRGR